MQLPAKCQNNIRATKKNYSYITEDMQKQFT